MKVTRTAEKIKLNQVLDVSVDVHLDVLNFFFVIGGREYADECSNRTQVIGKRLAKYHEIAMEHGRKTLRIICEPTGSYHNKLLRTARRMGFFTCFVNTESVAKFRVVETNDNNKTDQKDPRVIRTLAELDKVIRHRQLSDDYLMLRKLGKIWDTVDVSNTRLRCRLHKLMLELFCDYSFDKDFLYSNSGLALVEQYGCSPYRIIASSFEEFCKTMKEAAPRIQKRTLERLWKDAESSVLNEMPAGYIEVLQMHLYQLMEDFLKEEDRKAELSERMVEILDRLREDDPNIPPPTKGVVSATNLARLLGETGPLSDFDNYRKLMRYGGLNIRMRQSGKFKGQDKISKKGRPLLRKILNNIAFPLVRHGSLYGTFYHNKKDKDMMVGNKAMVVVARNFLRKFHGWYKSGEAFNSERFFQEQAEILKKAA